MVPPSAVIAPVLVTSASPLAGRCRTGESTSSESSPSPCRSTACVWAPARTTRPRRAVILPRLATWGATSAASPASRTVISPWFSMRASARPGWSNTIRPPRMKAPFAILAVETSSPAASTCAPRWNTTPDWLTMATCPLAWMRPAMAEGSGPVTRFSVTEPVEGCWNCTLWSRPISKLRQSMAARSVDWVMVVREAPCWMVAVPATTRPPCGWALDGWACVMPGRNSAVPESSAARQPGKLREWASMRGVLDRVMRVRTAPGRARTGRPRSAWAY